MAIGDLSAADVQDVRNSSINERYDALGSWTNGARTELEIVAEDVAKGVADRYAHQINEDVEEAEVPANRDAHEIAREVAQEVTDRLLGLIALAERAHQAKLAVNVAAPTSPPKAG